MTCGLKPVLFPFRRAIGSGASSSRSVWSEREGLCIRLDSPSAKVSGWGEASPLPGYSPESLSEVRQALEAVVFVPDILSKVVESADPADIQASVNEALDGLSAEPLPTQGSARFALETAWLDLAGRIHGLPMPALWSADPATAWTHLRVAELCPDVERLELPSREAARALKVKVGRDGAFGRELQALREIRRRHPALELRLDANGAWTGEMALENLKQLSELGIRWIEEPTTLRDKDELAQWIADAPVAVALDESLQRLAITAEDFERLRPAAVILKPHVLGGMRCLELGRSALNLGIETVVSHLFDGPLAYRSSYALALALDWMQDTHQAHGLAHHPGLGAWPEVEDALLAPPSTWGPGLGLSWEMP